MRVLAVLALMALTACAPGDPAAQAARDWQACTSATFEQARLHACSAVIASPQATTLQRSSALIERGVVRNTLGQHTRAIADFGRALRIDPNLARAYLERGLAHQTRGAYNDAVADYDRALALEPGLELAERRRQAALENQSQAALTDLETLTDAIEANPRNAELWNARCWERATLGVELEFALSDCNEALRLQPRYAEALDSRGLVYLKRHEYQAALADYEAALAIQPGDGHYLYGRGLARIALGDAANGEVDLRAAELAQPGIAALYADYGASAESFAAAEKN